MKSSFFPYLPDENSKQALDRIFSYSRFKRPSDGKVQGRHFMPVKVVPLNLFTDDMSGNRTKKYNKFDSWSMVPAALPLKQRHQLEFTNFICTDNVLSAMQMLPAIVDDLSSLEKGVEMMTPDGEKALVVAPVQFITADNARHAEIASSKGATSNRPCRKCNWEIKTAPRADGTDYASTRRSEAVVRSIYENFLSKGGDNLDLLDDTSRGYKLVGGQALLRLEAFETMIDNPIEVLHTVMLGVGKTLVKNLVRDHLNDKELEALQKLVRSDDSKGLKRKLSFSFRLHNFLVQIGYLIYKELKCMADCTTFYRHRSLVQ